MRSGLTGSCVQAVQFYKAWDAYGALSNFSCHLVNMPTGPMTDASAPLEASSQLDQQQWPSVEHYYQAQKFATASGKLQGSVVLVTPRSSNGLYAYWLHMLSVSMPFCIWYWLLIDPHSRWCNCCKMKGPACLNAQTISAA